VPKTSTNRNAKRSRTLTICKTSSYTFWLSLGSGKKLKSRFEEALLFVNSVQVGRRGLDVCKCPNLSKDSLFSLMFTKHNVEVVAGKHFKGIDDGDGWYLRSGLANNG
jgi:hypothetical protein